MDYPPSPKWEVINTQQANLAGFRELVEQGWSPLFITLDFRLQGADWRNARRTLRWEAQAFVDALSRRTCTSNAYKTRDENRLLKIYARPENVPYHNGLFHLHMIAFARLHTLRPNFRNMDDLVAFIGNHFGSPRLEEVHCGAVDSLEKSDNYLLKQVRNGTFSIDDLEWLQSGVESLWEFRDTHKRYKKWRRKQPNCINGFYGLYRDKNGDPYFDDIRNPFDEL